MTTKKNIVILGATGSIGQQTLDVVRQNNDKFAICGLVAYSSKDKLNAFAAEFDVKNTILVSKEENQEEANKKIIDMVQHPDVDLVLNAMSGAVGLQASFASLEAGKTLALANKESLVVGGDLIMPMAKELKRHNNNIPKLLPVDSEHGAIFQCLIGEENQEIYKLHITASGGPFYKKTKEELKNVTKDEALAHPTWNMGPKITIDSATLMNKGLEVIEAHHLFGVPYDKINVLVHRQSIVHSMVEYKDGSVKAHLGKTDMRIPIQYAMSYPDRWDSPVEHLNYHTLQDLSFDKPDCETFKCLKLAFKAGIMGGTMPCVMNAANEVAVSKFLNKEIGFLNIADIVEKTMCEAEKDESIGMQKVESLDQIKYIDKSAREIAQAV